MNKIKWPLGLMLFATIYSCSTKTQKADSNFDGMWRLDKFESFDSLVNRWMEDSTRMGWRGFIHYDGHGHMGVHLIPKGYKNFDTNMNRIIKDLISHKSNIVK